MGHVRRITRAITAYLSRYGRLVEVGIGHRTAVAIALADNGRTVTATDIDETYGQALPATVDFVVDDIVTPDHRLYADADAIYALNLPPELHRPAATVARTVDAELLFTTLGGEQPAIAVERISLPGETLYRMPSRRTFSVSSPTETYDR